MHLARHLKIELECVKTALVSRTETATQLIWRPISKLVLVSIMVLAVILPVMVVIILILATIGTV